MKSLVEIPKIKTSLNSKGSQKIVELDTVKFSKLLFPKKTNFLKPTMKNLNPQNQGRMAGFKQTGMSRQMRKKGK